MADLIVHLELDEADDATADAAASVLQTQLSALPEVEEAEAAAQRTRFTGVEVVAVVSVAIALTKGAREIAEEVPKLVRAIMAAVKDLKRLPAGEEAESAKVGEPARVRRITLNAGDRQLVLENPSEVDVEALARTWAAGGDQPPYGGPPTSQGSTT